MEIQTVTSEENCEADKGILSMNKHSAIARGVARTLYEIGDEAELQRQLADLSSVSKFFEDRQVRPIRTLSDFARELAEETSKIFEGRARSVESVKSIRVLEDGTSPTVYNSPKELRKGENLSLRTAYQTMISSEIVELQQFDPNFFSSGNQILCRYPGCKQQRSRQQQREDLYLCPCHRNNLKERIANMCAESQKRASASTEENLKRYTSMIGLLENSYHSLTMKTPWIEISKDTAILLQEVCLNMRNYFLIVNALLNPDEDNVEVAVPAHITTFRIILQLLRNTEYSAAMLVNLRGLVALLKELIRFTLFHFGIIYSWVYLTMTDNPGAQLGAGVGAGAGGLLGLFQRQLGVTVPSLFAIIFGGVCGWLIGGGLYNWWSTTGSSREDENFRRYLQLLEQADRCHEEGHEEADEQQQEIIPLEEERPVYYVTANRTGNLALAILSRFMQR